MKKYFIAASVAGLLLGSFAFAQMGNTAADRLALMANKVMDKCQAVEARINTKVATFDHNKAQHIESYQNTKTKVAALVTKLEAEGYDVDMVKADLVTYDSMIQKFAADYAIFVNSLEQTKTFTCGKSAGEFKAQLAAARVQMQTVHEDNVALRTYWAGTLKPAILALKDQVQAESTDTTEATTPVTTAGGQQ